MDPTGVPTPINAPLRPAGKQPLVIKTSNTMEEKRENPRVLMATT